MATSKLLTALPTSRVLTCDTVRFAHGVNSAAALEAALADPEVNFVEADVILGMPRRDGVRQPMQPVMGHDVGDSGGNDVMSFREFAAAVAGTGRGLKVDIKEWGAVAGVLSTLKEVEERWMHEHFTVSPWPFVQLRRGSTAFFDRPALMINADVLTGTGLDEHDGCRFNPTGVVLPKPEQVLHARDFVHAVCEALPSATLSLGWTTVPDAGSPRYSSAMVADMQAVIDGLAEHSVAITFACRAQYVPPSWAVLSPLLSHPLTTLTLWAHQRPTAVEMAWFHANLDPARTMYDVGDDRAAQTWWKRCTLAVLSAAVVAGGLWMGGRRVGMAASSTAATAALSTPSR